MTEKMDRVVRDEEEEDSDNAATGEGWQHFTALVAQVQKAVDDLNAFARLVPPVYDSIGTWLAMNKVRFGFVSLEVAREFSHHPCCLQEADIVGGGVGIGFLGHPLAVRVQNWLARLNVRFIEEIGDDDDNCEESSDCAVESAHKNSVANRLPVLAATQMFLCSLTMAPGMESDLLHIQTLTAEMQSNWRAMNAPRCSEKKSERLERLIDSHQKELRTSLWKFFDLLMLRDDEYAAAHNGALLRGIGRTHSHTLLSHVAHCYRLHPKTPDINKPFAFAITDALARQRAEAETAQQLQQRQYERNLLLKQMQQAEQRLSELDAAPLPRAKKAKVDDDDI
jgi:hypothetical protein